MIGRSRLHRVPQFIRLSLLEYKGICSSARLRNSIQHPNEGNAFFTPTVLHRQSMKAHQGSAHNNSHKFRYSTMVDGQEIADLTEVLNNNLHQLLSEPNIDHEKIYSTISRNIQYRVYDSRLLELVIFNFLQIGNLTAATTMLHMIFESDPKFKLSNQLWAVYIQDSYSTRNHHSAVLIYHHFIDNFNCYSHDNMSALSSETTNMPFLLSPSILEELAVTFQHSKDHIRVKGLLKYFKRFYSYISHKKAFRSLKIALVEAYSAGGDLEKSLSAFKDLSYSYRGHFNHKNWAKLNQMQRMSVFTNHVWRRNNIKSNSNRYLNEFPDDLKTHIDKFQIDSARILGLELYNPIIDRNVYTSPNSVSMPLLNGSLHSSDLPQFQALIKKNLKDVVSKDQGVSSIFPTIVSSHFMLHVFIVKGLCQTSHFKEAFSILVKLPHIFPYIDEKVLVRDENYLNILHYMKVRLKANSHDESKLKHTLKDVMNHYNENLMRSKHSLSSKIYQQLFSTILSFSSTTCNDLEFYGSKFLRGKPTVGSYIHLDTSDFAKYTDLISINPELEAKLSCIIRELD